MSNPINQSNSQGLSAAYARAGELTPFDYREIAREVGNDEMSRRLVALAADLQPDLVHLEKAELVSEWGFAELRACTDARLMYVFPDYRPTLPAFVRHACPYADWVLYPHADPTWRELCEAAGARRTGFWTRGVDPAVFAPVQAAPQYDLIMLANQVGQQIDGVGWGARADFVLHMASAGFRVDLFGHGNIVAHDNITAHEHRDLADFARTVSEARISLAFNTANVLMYCSWRRVFNTLAAGGFLLIHYFPGLEMVFENGQHLVWFETFDEAVDLVRHYLAHDDERARIAAQGWQEVITRHTWDIRIRRMLGLAFERGRSAA